MPRSPEMPVVRGLPLDGLGSALRALSEVLAAQGVPWMLVGAVARDVRLYHLPIPPAEAAFLTKDADVGVEVASASAFEAVKERLVDEGWRMAGNSDHKMVSPGGLEVDVVPFGDVEDPVGSVAFQQGGFRMNVTGYGAAWEAATPVDLEGTVVRVITLPFYTLLKCLAWEDRRARTLKDAEDLARVFDRYDDLWMGEEGGCLVAQHIGLFDVEDDALARSARVLGREARAAAERDPHLVKELTRWLSIQSGEDFRRIVGDMGTNAIGSAARRQAAWEAFARGWEDDGP